MSVIGWLIRRYHLAPRQWDCACKRGESRPEALASFSDKVRIIHSICIDKVKDRSGDVVICCRLCRVRLEDVGRDVDIVAGVVVLDCVVQRLLKARWRKVKRLSRTLPFGCMQRISNSASGYWVCVQS